MKKTLGDNIKRLMVESKIGSINQLHQMLIDEFGKRALSRRSLSTIMNKRITPKGETLAQLAQIFRRGPHSLLYNTGIPITKGNTEKLAFSDKYGQINRPLCHEDLFSVEKICIEKRKKTYLEFPKSVKEETFFFYCLKGKLEVSDKANPKIIIQSIKAKDYFSLVTDRDLCLKNVSNVMCMVLLVASPQKIGWNRKLITMPSDGARTYSPETGKFEI